MIKFYIESNQGNLFEVMNFENNPILGDFNKWFSIKNYSVEEYVKEYNKVLKDKIVVNVKFDCGITYSETRQIWAEDEDNV